MSKPNLDSKWITTKKLKKKKKEEFQQKFIFIIWKSIYRVSWIDENNKLEKKKKISMK